MTCFRSCAVPVLRADRPMNLKMKLDENKTRDGVNVLELAFTDLVARPWPDRTAMQGGKGLSAGKRRSMTVAAFLSKLAVTPYQSAS